MADSGATRLKWLSIEPLGLDWWPKLSPPAPTEPMDTIDERRIEFILCCRWNELALEICLFVCCRDEFLFLSFANHKFWPYKAYLILEIEPQEPFFLLIKMPFRYHRHFRLTPCLTFKLQMGSERTDIDEKTIKCVYSHGRRLITVTGRPLRIIFGYLYVLGLASLFSDRITPASLRV